MMMMMMMMVLCILRDRGTHYDVGHLIENKISLVCGCSESRNECLNIFPSVSLSFYLRSIIQMIQMGLTIRLRSTFPRDDGSAVGSRIQIRNRPDQKMAFESPLTKLAFLVVSPVVVLVAVVVAVVVHE